MTSQLVPFHVSSVDVLCRHVVMPGYLPVSGRDSPVGVGIIPPAAIAGGAVIARLGVPAGGTVTIAYSIALSGTAGGKPEPGVPVYTTGSAVRIPERSTSVSCSSITTRSCRSCESAGAISAVVSAGRIHVYGPLSSVQVTPGVGWIVPTVG